MTENMLQAKKDFSRFGLALLAIGIITVLVQVLLGVVWELCLRDSGLGQLEITRWIITIAPMYLIAVPAGYWILSKIPAEPAEKQKLSIGRFLLLMLMCIPVMYIGNYIGSFMSSLLSGGTAENTVIEFATSNLIYGFIFTVLLAPLMEEFIFRKQIIDRLGKYGEETAIFFSAITFGLFHMNLFQFFYAFGLGLMFAYVYTRTRMLRYPVIMHMIINFMGGVLAPILISMLDMDLIEKAAAGDITASEISQILLPVLAFYAYLFALLGCVIAGVVLLVLRWNKRVFHGTSCELLWGTDRKIAYCNLGMILFFLFCFIMMILALF